MLSERLKNSINAVDERAKDKTLNQCTWDLFVDNVKQIAKELEQMERTVEPNPNDTKPLPPNVVRLAEFLDKRGVTVGPHPVEGDTA
ncbi:MAG: hypothetical protein OQJ97_18625 [Rhodospirillales bacterium]|nr:hypothetical protein [Rhodospirillales bacterium]